MRIPSATDIMVDQIVEIAASPVVLMILEAGNELSGVLEGLMKLAAEDWDDQIIFLKVWADEHPTLMEQLHVVELPAVLIYCQRRRYAQHTGVPSARELTNLLDGALKVNR